MFNLATISAWETPEVVYLRMCGRVVVSLAWRWETRAFQQKSSEQCG
jgi:hypothetical protein